MKKKAFLITTSIIIAIVLIGMLAINSAFNLVMKYQLGALGIIDDINLTDKAEDDGNILEDEMSQEERDPIKEDEGEDGQANITNEEEFHDKKQEEASQFAKDSNKKDAGKDNTPKSTDTPGINIGNNKLKEIERAVSLSDKTKAISIVFGSLSQADIAKLTQLAGQGASGQAQAKTILSKSLNQQQKSTLKALYSKYQHLLK